MSNEIAGFTYVKEYDCFVCGKCASKVQRGIVNISKHWNECIDNNQTISLLTSFFEEKQKLLKLLQTIGNQ